MNVSTHQASTFDFSGFWGCTFYRMCSTLWDWSTVGQFGNGTNGTNRHNYFSSKSVGNDCFECLSLGSGIQ
ncbi:hypothetical protein AZE42_11930 [Rhizopogon vesiculosus]|uniref:Uncharacterized protein n=1 Tax=Rhizopogon vesiculosus TaxID=180088 RepID=A0A1J8Q962_9AGAM|nr:hypothetical protein AZE42_11930 [Rhizopogon vesiculosus]